MFLMVDYVKKMTVKKFCKYGEYGSFEHLLFLLCVSLCLLIYNSLALVYMKFGGKTHRNKF